MLDFTPVREKQISWQEFAKDLSKQDLVDLTNAIADKQLALIANCTDADVTFQPIDTDAHDPHAEDPDDENLAWNLGHIIVHATSSSEESAFLAAELARGVDYERRRSRYEVQWETVTSIAQCRARIEESRRMVLGTLQVWPDEPFIDNSYEPREGIVANCFVRFVFGMSHAEGHLGQIEEIVRQAHA